MSLAESSRNSGAAGAVRTCGRRLPTAGRPPSLTLSPRPDGQRILGGAPRSDEGGARGTVEPISRKYFDHHPLLMFVIAPAGGASRRDCSPDQSVLRRRAPREMKSLLICELKCLLIHPARDAEPSDVTDCRMSRNFAGDRRKRHARRLQSPSRSRSIRWLASLPLRLQFRR